MSGENIQRVEFAEITNTEGNGNTVLNRNFGLVKEVPIQLDVKLGSLDSSIGQLFSLQEGEVIELSTGVDQEIELILDGNVVAKGLLVAVGDNFGIEITNIKN
ncbi:MAG: FliM/FliN family flagellar motor switch protein [Alteromonadaceae bacterium]|nr:FliM/FliN family flagellar motor switch protein [Alteromonadaceae bacterium]